MQGPLRGNLVAARSRASKSGSRGEGVGSGKSVERRGRVNYGMKKFTSWIGWQYLRDLDSYCMACHLKIDKLYGVHVFELIQCYQSEI